MPRQAGMIGANRAAHFKGHVSEAFLMPAVPATQAAILLRVRPNRNPVRRESRSPQFFALPLNKFFCSSARCPLSAHGQAKSIAIGRKSSDAIYFVHHIV